MLDTKTKTQASKYRPPLLVWIHISSDVWPLFSLASTKQRESILFAMFAIHPGRRSWSSQIDRTHKFKKSLNSVPCVLAAQAKEFLKAAASTCIKSKPPKALTSGRKSWKTKGTFKKWCCFRTYRNSRITPSKTTGANLISAFSVLQYLFAVSFMHAFCHSCMFVVFFVPVESTLACWMSSS